METHLYPPGLLERHLQPGIDVGSGGGRTHFERDKDRILYSSAFRAMALKTQVVAVAELGYTHNRLTHSLKVSQVGGSIARRLNRDGRGISPELVEAACLAHDIGHPPFGHAGEAELNKVVEKHRKAERDAESIEDIIAPLDGFEGNAQNLRVLTRLATHRQWREPGLHLTRATLAASTKYPWLRSAEGKRARKWGAYEGDAETLDWVLKEQPSDGEKPVEAVLMDWADDVTYAVHDVEDFVRLGLIPLDRLFAFNLAPDHRQASREESPTLATFLDWVESKWVDDTRFPEFQRGEIVKELHYVADKISVADPFDGSRDCKGRLATTVTDLISFFADDVAISGDGFGYSSELVVPDRMDVLCELLKELIWFYVIARPSFASQQHGQARIIADLFDWTYEDSARLLPRDRQDELSEHGDLIRVVADHIASLTEPMALTIHKKLSGTDLGAVTDLV